ncbi:type II secretion system F family protein [Cellulosilyticum ruminicola]|uniref:type II secretion system F family protein n=1 Tax=Cellulosilyticum ruminicola TaxID=425254 RepID=UPI0006D210A1|nr:type II secretion system F family protein [Cellulosilyticum ruminicola]
MLELKIEEKRVVLKEKLPLKEINLFCKQFLAMLQAGVHITKALEICIESCGDKGMKVSLNQIYAALMNGYSFSEAMDETNVFPRLLVSMIACGEASGNMCGSLKEVIMHFEQQLEMHSKIKKALIYPMIVVGAVVIVTIILMIKVIPNFMLLLTETGAEIPRTTQIVIAVSEFFVKYGIEIGIALCVCLTIGYLFAKSKQGKVILDSLSLKLPIIGCLNKKIITVNFANTMSMLIAAGVPILQAMEMTKKVIKNNVMQNELENAIHYLHQGSSLHNALQGGSVCPSMLIQMIYIGEEIGEVDEMLRKIGMYFKEEVDAQMMQCIILIEPTLTLILAVLIGGMMLAIMQPIFSAATAII